MTEFFFSVSTTSSDTFSKAHQADHLTRKYDIVWSYFLWIFVERETVLDSSLWIRHKETVYGVETALPTCFRVGKVISSTGKVIITVISMKSIRLWRSTPKETDKRGVLFQHNVTPAKTSVAPIVVVYEVWFWSGWSCPLFSFFGSIWLSSVP